MRQGGEYLRSSSQYQAQGYADTADTEFEQAQEQYRQAIDSFEAVLEQEPENTSALINLGAAYYSALDADSAISSYQRALELDPDDAAIHSNLAAVYVNLQQLDSALAEYQRALELDPELAEAHFGLGVVYWQMQNTDRAISSFEKFQELDTGTDPLASSQAAEYLRELRGE
jgi:tetratricopeptide (TPR) repeat protein